MDDDAGPLSLQLAEPPELGFRGQPSPRPSDADGERHPCHDSFSVAAEQRDVDTLPLQGPNGIHSIGAQRITEAEPSQQSTVVPQSHPGGFVARAWSRRRPPGVGRHICERGRPQPEPAPADLPP